MNQTITKGGPVAPVSRYVDVTAPRFALAPGELLSTFPPANSVGAFDNRLPQVTFRRRTLPWERSAGSATNGPPDPWLALVILAEGEANFRSGVHISDALPPNILAAQGITEDGTCDVLEVSHTVVQKVFPAKEELSLLTQCARSTSATRSSPPATTTGGSRSSSPIGCPARTPVTART